MEDRIRQLERATKRLKLFSGLLGALVLAFAAVVFVPGPIPDTLRLRGLVIEDEAGRERILIGAPIPEAQNRVRTDSERVREAWSDRYPDSDQYMESYQTYTHETNGILILDEEGFDRIALGDPVPDSNIGQRIGPQTGVVINDGDGSERSGYGLLEVEGRERVVLGMDTDRSEEGVLMFLMDSGPAGVAVLNGERELFLGNAPANSPITGLTEPIHGLLVRNGADIRMIGEAP